MSCGVMVTQCPLEALFIVRVYAGQPYVARSVAVSTTPCEGVRASSNLVEQPTFIVELSTLSPYTDPCNE